MRLFLMAATAAGFALTTFMMAEEAVAVQDTPTTINGIETVCTGVGSAKDDPRWSAYPVKIVLATTGGANLANAHVSLRRTARKWRVWIATRPGSCSSRRPAATPPPPL